MGPVAAEAGGLLQPPGREERSLHPVRLLPGDRTFLVDPDEDVLTAGLRQGIDLRYGCRHGKCTTCKYVVVEGDVVHRGASPYAFSDRELEEGGVLLCSTFARSPLVISPFGEQPSPDGFAVIPPQERSAVVISMTPVSSDLVEVRLRPDSPLDYRAGQYVELGLPGSAVRRSYSIANPPGPEPDLEFLVDASHRQVLDALAAAGGPVTVLGPFGRLFYRPAEQLWGGGGLNGAVERPILMVASGAGLAPLLAVLREFRDGGGGPPVQLYYGARDGGIPRADELARLARELPAFTFHPVDIPADGPPRSRQGARLGPIVRRIGRELPDASGYDAYVAGPVALCDAVEGLLTAKGLPERRCFCERFYSIC